MLCWELSRFLVRDRLPHRFVSWGGSPAVPPTTRSCEVFCRPKCAAPALPCSFFGVIEYSVAADGPCKLYWQAAQSLLLFHRACCTCTSERRASVSAAAFSSSLQVQKRIKGLRKHSCLFSPVPWSATGIYEAHPTPEQQDFKTSTSVCASVCEGERERERAKIISPPS